MWRGEVPISDTVLQNTSIVSFDQFVRRCVKFFASLCSCLITFRDKLAFQSPFIRGMSCISMIQFWRVNMQYVLLLYVAR